MHLIRRAALRAASASSTSFISSSRSVSTSSPIVLRSKVQSSISTSVFRRFNSDEASGRKVESADSEHGSVSQAIDSASKTTSTYAKEASEGFSESAARSIEGSSEGAGAGGFAPRGDYQQRESRPRYDNYRGGDRGGYGGDRRGGYGGGRDNGMSRGGDRGGYGRNDRSAGTFNTPERVLTPNPSLYIGNLLFDVTAQDLEKEFSEYGTIKSATIATDPRGLSKGFGYIEFETTEQAAAAIEARHQSQLEGRRLIVNYQAKTTSERRQENPPSKTLFIGNLAFEMSDADLNKLFRDIRNVIDVRVAIDRRTGQPRGFAHADFVDTESAIKGKEALLGKEVYGRALRVDFSAGVRENRPDRGFRSGDRGDQQSY